MAAHFFADTAVLTGRSMRHILRSPDTIITTVVTPVSGRPLIGLMAGRAFTFRYAETEELLRAAGCQLSGPGR